MVANPQQDDVLYMSEAEYLAFEEKSDIRHEYVNGYVYAMTGGSLKHNIIVANINTRLNLQLEKQNCIVPDSNTRVRVESKSVSYRYPDVTIICGEPKMHDERTDTVFNPIVLVEVLSPSTQIIDRNDKLEEYLKIDSLKEYLLVSQDKAKIEQFFLQDDGSWGFQLVTGLEKSITLPSINCQLSLADVYLKVDFEDEDTN